MLKNPNESGGFRVDATVADGLRASASVRVTLSDVNERPVFGEAVYEWELAENAAGPVAVGRAEASDADADDERRYRLAGAGAARFAVDAETGAVSYVGDGEDYEVRLAPELTGRWMVGEGAAVRARVELGVRLDGGDAETGVGREAGGELGFTHLGTGLSVEARIGRDGVALRRPNGLTGGTGFPRRGPRRSRPWPSGRG